MSKKKDRAPAEVVAIRKQREHRRVVRATVIFIIWLAAFTVGAIINSEALMWFAFALSWVNNVVLYGLYEKTLRKIAARPPVDYDRIRKLEKRELPKVGELWVR